MNIETTIANAAVVVIAFEKIGSIIASRIKRYRHKNGAHLQVAFRDLGDVYESLHALYLKLKPEDSDNPQDNGFYSLRLYIAHNGGSPLSETMNWKCSSFSTYPSSHKKLDDWQGHPMDHEYISKVLEPTVVHGYKHTRRTHDLDHRGQLGAMLLNRNIAQMLTFLIKATDTEIVFAATMFTNQTLTPAQIHEIQETRTAIVQRVGRGSSTFFNDGGRR